MEIRGLVRVKKQKRVRRDVDAVLPKPTPPPLDQRWVPPRPPEGVRAVRIYGCADGVELAPPPYPGFEVWCFNNPWAQRRMRGRSVLSEWTHWFNLHTFRHQVLCYPRGLAYLMRKDGSRPVFLQEASKDVPGSVTFPKDAMIKFFGHRYFTCSGSWLIAYAIFTGVQWLELWGFRMAAGGEHAGQRAGYKYWVNEARRRGMVVQIPPGLIGHPDGDGTEDKLIEDPKQYRGFLYGYDPHSNYYRENF